MSDIIPPGELPPLKKKDLPEPVPIRRMIGPGIMLAGLALGSGEFILWPYITFRSGFVFFWACLVGVATQYFLNVEIMRWTLATGESVTTGFIRLSRWWASVFLVLNIVPWMLPAWAKGAAQMTSWLIWGPQIVDGKLISPYEMPLAIAGMLLCGMILTAGPVVYETVEKIQFVLVSAIILIVIVLAVWLLKDRPDAIVAQAKAVATLGWPQFVPKFDPVYLTPAMLLGALAFAGAGGTMNLGQSNYIKEKGYGMGALIGRITSPITGKEESISEIGYHFPHTPENLARWRRWWRAACTEHFFSFFFTCTICLVLLTLISYVLFYDASGKRITGEEAFKDDLKFVWAEAGLLRERIGPAALVLFLLMGVAILLTTEFGVLDVVSRIAGDIVKTAWLRESAWWTESKLYYLFLWGVIALGTGILLLEAVGVNIGALRMFKLTSALNGGVMFIYSCTLLYMNALRLPPGVRMRPWRMATIAWSAAFFGFFSFWAVIFAVQEMLPK